MPNRQPPHFHELPTGTMFDYNGNTWRKRSTRTAEIVYPLEHAGVWFYFGKRDQCIPTAKKVGA